MGGGEERDGLSDEYFNRVPLCVPGGNKKIDLCLPLSTEIIHIQSQQLQQNKSEVLEAVESGRSKPQKNGKKQLVPYHFLSASQTTRCQGFSQFGTEGYGECREKHFVPNLTRPTAVYIYAFLLILSNAKVL